MKKNLLFCLFLLIPVTLQAQSIDMDQIYADEEFRLGVVSFHQGFFNKAIQSLERSLVYKPENPLVRQWLGRVYYQSGYEDAALNEWKNLIDQEQADSALVFFYDMVERRRGVTDEMREEDSWVELLSLEKDQAGESLFQRPTSVASSADGRGRFFTVSFASNLISIFNPNGDRVNQFNGGVDGFAHPFDIQLLDDGNFLVSEYDADRISLCNDQGYRQQAIGSTGRGEGRLLGPQFMAVSGEYFYVTDWGNKEVDKFTLTGEPVLSFGEHNGVFPGFQGPSGICITPEGLAVADVIARQVYLFDENGNYLRTLINRGLNQPEGLTLDSEGRLIIADGERVLAYDFSMDSINLLFQSEMENGRILKVAFDENGNLLIPDFNNNQLSLMTELSTLYGGLFLRIEKIESRSYPDIYVDFTLEDAYGNPYIGLDSSNFLVKEGEQYIPSIDLVDAGYLHSRIALQLLFEDSPQLKERGEQVEYVLNDFLQRRTNQDSYSFYSVSSTPFIIAQGEDNPYENLQKFWYNSQTGSDEWQFDTSLRMAASDMLQTNDRRVIVYFSSGDMPDHSFDNFGLVESASYLKNNNIIFFPVYFDMLHQSEELNYLAEQTGGEAYYSLDPQGVGRLLDDCRRVSRGNYRIHYESLIDTDFGRRYLPLSLEVNYLRKSSRDELGYFAPLDYEPRE